MSFNAKKGEFIIAEDVDHRNVDSHLRRYASMFSPSSSRSRFDVRDSGRRYEVRLVNGLVEFRTHGTDWQPLSPPLGGRWGVSYQTKRGDGDDLTPVAFDMIAASRGRLIAKERGTDRLFHLVMNPLFRTWELDGAAGLSWLRDGGDPIVPSNYFKLDPGFFDPDAAVKIPPELKANYADHPASIRFKLVVEMMQVEMSDNICVPVRPGEWQLIDGRSPLKIVDMDDLRCVGDSQLKQVATMDRIKRILEQGSPQAGVEDAIRSMIAGLVDLTPSVPLPGPVNEKLGKVKDAIDDVQGNFDDLVNWAAGLPGASNVIGPLRDAIEEADSQVNGLRNKIISETEKVVERLLTDAVLTIEQGVADKVFTVAAAIMRELIESYGFGAIIYFAPIVLALKEQDLQKKGVLVFHDPASSPPLTLPELVGGVATNVVVGSGVLEHTPFELEGEPEPAREHPCGSRTQIRIHVHKLLQYLQDENNSALRGLVDRLIQAAARQAIPNAPPADIPTYVHVTYERDVSMVPAHRRPPPNARERHHRRSIAYGRVLDIAIGTTHWSEQWQENFGGEIHSLLATYPFAQQERFSLMHYRFLNGPIIDGDGWCDGTTNFYQLVELEEPEPPAKKGHIQVPSRRGPEPSGRYAILWHDEQTYFTQRWRLVHPTRDTAGDMFSLARALRDKPKDFRFDIRSFWSPLDTGCVTRDSRLQVVRQILALTGRDATSGAHEIYTICFAFGICDHSWRWRAMPHSPRYEALDQSLAAADVRLSAPSDEVLYTNTLTLRDDGTLSIRGFRRIDAALTEGRWVQRYLPADCRHAPDRTQLEPGVKPEFGFTHPWEFVPEPTYRKADAFYAFNVYDKDVNSRCQYYEVDILPDEKGVVTPVSELRDSVWINGGDVEQPLTIDTMSFDWRLPEVQGYTDPKKLIIEGRDAETISMYEQTTRFRLLERRPKGVIAMFYDKRDDDLQSVSHLPRETTLLEEHIEPRSFDGHRPKQPPKKKEEPPRRRLRVRFRANHRVNRQPIVQQVKVSRVRANGVTMGVAISFWTSQTGDQVHENIWRVHMAALDDEGNRVALFTSDVFGTFARVAEPTSPLPLDYTRQDVLKPEYEYAAVLHVTTENLRSRVDRYCSSSGRRDHGTAVWFEDIVGHACAPEATVFVD